MPGSGDEANTPTSPPAAEDHRAMSDNGGDSPTTDGLQRSKSVPNLSFGGQHAKEVMAALRASSNDPNKSEGSLELEDEWTIWFDKSNRKTKTTKGGRTIYEDCIVELGTFSTVQGFWTYWDSLHVHNLKDHCNLRVFKRGIKPLWEDPMNKTGGKWVVRGVPKETRKELWTDLITHLIAGRLRDNSQHTVCGVVMSTRDNGDSMQLWVDGGLTLEKDGETPENEARRMSLPSTDEMLRNLLFPNLDAEHSKFIYQTHMELQQGNGSGKEKSSYHAARDTLDAGQASALAAGALSGIETSPPEGSPTSFHGTTIKTNQTPADILRDSQQDSPKASSSSGQLGSPQNPIINQATLAAGHLPMGAHVLPSMLPGMLPIVPMMAVGGNMNQQMLFGQYPMMMAQGNTTLPAGSLPGTQLGGQSPSPNADVWAKESDCSDDEDPSVSVLDHNQDVPEPVRAIQERAKLIRTVRKKIRYINFFLQRQGKGRELTASEKQRVKSQPFLERELQLLEELQFKEVENQKRILGVDSLEFLRKPQQPMTYASEKEKRFKTMRAIRKKIRFIHYHLERQRQGKVLSPAELAKVNALPEFEQKLAELEAEEAMANEEQMGPDGTPSMPPPQQMFPGTTGVEGANNGTPGTPIMQNAPSMPGMPQQPQQQHGDHSFPSGQGGQFPGVGQTTVLPNNTQQNQQASLFAAQAAQGLAGFQLGGGLSRPCNINDLQVCNVLMMSYSHLIHI